MTVTVTVRELIALIAAAGGLTTAVTVATAPIGLPSRILARWMASSATALALTGALAVHAASPPALACAVMVCVLALVGRAHTRRLSPHAAPGGAPALADGVLATVFYTEFRSSASVGLSAPMLVVVPDVGGRGVELCQN